MYYKDDYTNMLSETFTSALVGLGPDDDGLTDEHVEQMVRDMIEHGSNSQVFKDFVDGRLMAMILGAYEGMHDE